MIVILRVCSNVQYVDMSHYWILEWVLCISWKDWIHYRGGRKVIGAVGRKETIGNKYDKNKKMTQAVIAFFAILKFTSHYNLSHKFEKTNSIYAAGGKRKN